MARSQRAHPLDRQRHRHRRGAAGGGPEPVPGATAPSGSRCYGPGQKRWIGDNRGSEHGDRWITELRVSFEAVADVFPVADTMPPADETGSRFALLHRSRIPELEPPRDDFVSRVAEVCRLRRPNATVTPVQGQGLTHLRVAGARPVSRD